MVGSVTLYNGALVFERIHKEAAAHVEAILARNNESSLFRSHSSLRREKGSKLSENILYLTENARTALGGLVVHLQRGVELFEQLALLLGELCRRNYANMIVEIAAAAAVRI